MKSKRSHEGYLLIDHRACPGIMQELAHEAGRDTLAIPSGQQFESATITCHHCQRVVVLNPDRSRERGYCRSCDHFICDSCTATLHATGECLPFEKIIAIVQKAGGVPIGLNKE